MTFYHFANCLALTFVPLYLVYKYSALSESGSIWRCSLGFCGYILTQLCKFIVVATLMIPAPASIDSAIDCLGLFYILTKQHKASLPQVKILSTALGWSFGQSLATRFADFYISARSLQFEWKNLWAAADANVCMVQNMSLCALLWLLSRGSGSSKIFELNSTTKQPAIIIGLYLLGLSFPSDSILVKIALVSFLAVGTLLTVDLRK